MDNAAAPPAPHIRSISEVLGDLKTAIDGREQVSIGDLVEALHERGIAMLLVLFALPMALPFPVPPGINVMLATPLLILTAQQALGAHRVWLPGSVGGRHFSAQKLAATIEMCLPWTRRVEVLVRPRLGFLTQDGPSRLCGMLGVLMALTVMIPLPLTNTVPSLGIAVMAAGVTMRDGLAVIAGALIGMGWITMLAVCVIVFGPEAFDLIRHTVKSLWT